MRLSGASCLAALLAVLALPSAHAIRFGEEPSIPAASAVGVINAHIFGRFCTGTLIAEDLVLTASHCVLDRTGLNRFQMEINGRIAAVIAKRQLSKSYDRELTLLKLSRAHAGVDFPELAGSSPARGNSVVSVGFGVTESQMRLARRQGELAVAERQAIAIEGNPVLWVLMPTRKGQLPCMGDSGAPQFTRRSDEWTLSFVTSLILYGTDKNPKGALEVCRAGEASGAVSVAENIEWLRRSIDELTKNFDLRQEPATFADPSEASEAQSWEQARTFCQTRSARLPELGELHLLAYKQALAAGPYWSSETLLGTAWTVDAGIETRMLAKTAQAKVLCVRNP